MGTAGSASTIGRWMAGRARPSLPRRWTKLGPGSSSGGKSGSVMATRRLAGGERVDSPSCGGRGRRREVVERVDQEVGAVAEVAQRVVAAEAEEAAYSLGAMLVVDVEGDAVGGPAPADGASPALSLQHGVVLLRSQTEFALEMASSVVPGLASAQAVQPTTLGHSLRVGPSPRLGAFLRRLGIGAVARRGTLFEARFAVAPQAVDSPRGGVVVLQRLDEAALRAAFHGLSWYRTCVR